jgi:uncharacterized protein (DUF2062 family)
LKKYLPTKDQLRSQKSLRFLGDVIFENNLWHFNRHSVSYAVLVGLFCCFLPMPFQMIPGVFLCVWVGANIPLAVALIWISNPITIPAMFYATYRLGTLLLGHENRVDSVSLSWEWLSGQLANVWQPLLLGSLVTGITLGVLGFIGVRLYWRWRISRYWHQRRRRMPKIRL